MDKKINDILNDKENNFLLPFYWQKGTHTDKIPMQIEEIYNSGCKAFCVESRIHPEFIKDGWWRDMDIILKEAQKRNMQVWLLDDDRFPSGHAVGRVGKEFPEYRAWELISHHVDVQGPAKDAMLLVNIKDDDVLLGAYAYKRRADEDETCYYDAIDLTGNIKSGFLYWDVPEGVWRIFLYFKSHQGSRADYIDMLNPDAVKMYIDTVYESHFEHYKEYFGNTFQGFFSDEPCFGNDVIKRLKKDYGLFEKRVGCGDGLALPWSDQVPKMMQETLGFDPMPHLNLLWYEDGENGNRQAEIRYAYMKAITDLYSTNFNKQLASWCHDHNVLYIGHIIEDMNCRLSSGVGHYFKALKWQDMSGIDVVLHQIIPGLSDYVHSGICGERAPSGAFYHYVLAKLGASLAHLTPHMKNRAMCEIFGAYGWGEDSEMMKFLMDHMLVRGINHFVPHAFSPVYPNPDCPPHFGAEGNDPSSKAFTALMNYTNKVSHLLYDTTHVANALVLYHAEGEWASRLRNASTVDSIAKALYDNHIDYDIAPFDIIEESATVEEGRIRMNNEFFDCLVVPYADHLPKDLIKTLEKLNESANVWFMESLPENLTFNGTVVKEENLVQKMRDNLMTDVTVDGDYPKLRIYHATRDNTHIYMFVNEDYRHACGTYVTVKQKGEYARLDILNDIYASGVSSDGRIKLSLAPNHSQIIVFTEGSGFPEEINLTQAIPLKIKYQLSLANNGDLSNFVHKGEFNKFFNINAPDFMPDFSGKMKYTFDFDFEKTDKRTFLDLGIAGQNAELILNGIPCGMRITTPYMFEITSFLKNGKNHAEVIVSNTPVNRERDGFSAFLQLKPSGLLGDICIRY